MSSYGIVGKAPRFKGRARLSELIEIEIQDEDGNPLSNVEYMLILPDDSKHKGTTDSHGCVTETLCVDTVRVKLLEDRQISPQEEAEEEFTISEEDLVYPENPGILPPMDLRNRNEGGQGPLQRNDTRKDKVEHLQRMLNDLGYELGTPGDEENGVDGLFQEKTEAAVKEFQKTHKDWEDQPLLVDGLVGPRTADALNRMLVGIWYAQYQTPAELTPERKLVTIAESLAVDEGTLV